MKNKIYLLLLIIFPLLINAQNKIKFDKEQLKIELAKNACSCIDSISVFNSSSKEISERIHKCIDKQIGAYQIGSKLGDIEISEKDTVKKIDVSINVDPNSNEYKKYYYEIERYLMDNCDVLKSKVALNEEMKEKSISNNPKALELYYKGTNESGNNNYKEAIKYYKEAIKIDPEFAFAWDNIGIAYRNLKEYDKAIDAYKNSLKIDPEGKTPLQNIAIVYIYTKEYNKAIKSYKKLAEIDKDNPEIFYGIGFVNYTYKKNYEKGLQNMCKAYNLYVEQKSPYRTDAEKIINDIYIDMKNNGDEKKFKKILKKNNISIE